MTIGLKINLQLNQQFCGLLGWDEDTSMKNPPEALSLLQHVQKLFSPQATISKLAAIQRCESFNELWRSGQASLNHENEKTVSCPPTQSKALIKINKNASKLLCFSGELQQGFLKRDIASERGL